MSRAVRAGQLARGARLLRFLHPFRLRYCSFWSFPHGSIFRRSSWEVTVRWVRFGLLLRKSKVLNSKDRNTLLPGTIRTRVQTESLDSQAVGEYLLREKATVCHAWGWSSVCFRCRQQLSKLRWSSTHNQRNTWWSSWVGRLDNMELFVVCRNFGVSLTISGKRIQDRNDRAERRLGSSMHDERSMDQSLGTSTSVSPEQFDQQSVFIEK